MQKFEHLCVKVKGESMLRLIRKEEAPEEENKRFKSSAQCPILAAFLDGLTFEKAPGSFLLKSQEEAELLNRSFAGIAFSHEDLDAVEAFFRTRDPYVPDAVTQLQHWDALEKFVEQELARVGASAWLQVPLHQLEERVDHAKRTKGAACNLLVLRAFFVALMTIRATGDNVAATG